MEDVVDVCVMAVVVDEVELEVVDVDVSSSSSQPDLPHRRSTLHAPSGCACSGAVPVACEP